LTADESSKENADIFKSTSDLALSNVQSDFIVDKNVPMGDVVHQVTPTSVGIIITESDENCDVALSANKNPSTENANISYPIPDIALNDVQADSNEDKNVTINDDRQMALNGTFNVDDEDAGASKILDLTFDSKELMAYSVNETIRIEENQVSMF
jgi:hypothetical protein